MRLLFSILFWAFFALSSAVLFVVAAAVWVLTWPFDRNRLVLHLYSCAWATMYFAVNPLWQLRVEGRDKLPWRGGAVLVANHQSLGDVHALVGLFRPFKWVSKASVFNLPFLGWNMRLNGYVPIRRGDKQSIGEMMSACERWLRRGVPVLLFPEGTRSSDGEVKAFKDGAFRLALSTGCPVIPVVLTGTADTLPKHGLVLRTRCRCRVKVLDPIAAGSCGDDVGALRDRVRQLIVAELEHMRAGAS